MHYLQDMVHRLISQCYRYLQSLRKFHSISYITLFFLFVIVSSGAAVLSDAGNKVDYVNSDEGDDVIVYTPALNLSQQDHYDGGSGTDTLWFRMSASEYYNPLFQADLIRYFAYLIQHADPSHQTGIGSQFKFSAFNLSVRNLENLVIERVGEATITRVPPPVGLIKIFDSSAGSLT